MTTNLESLGAAGGEGAGAGGEGAGAGGEGAGVVKKGEAVVSKLPTEGSVPAGERVVGAAGTAIGGSDSAHAMGSRGESSTMARIEVEIMLLEPERERMKTFALVACVASVLVRVVVPMTQGGATFRTTVIVVPSISVISMYSASMKRYPPTCMPVFAVAMKDVAVVETAVPPLLSVVPAAAGIT